MQCGVKYEKYNNHGVVGCYWNNEFCERYYKIYCHSKPYHYTIAICDYLRCCKIYHPLLKIGGETPSNFVCWVGVWFLEFVIVV